MSRNQDTSDLTDIKRIDENDVRYLWHLSWWDGPLHGMAEYHETKVWFDYHHEDEEGRHYFYVLYPLTDTQLQIAETWIRTQGEYIRNQETMHWEWVGRDHDRHDSEWNGPDFTGITPIGWFMDGANSDFYGIKVTKPDDSSNKE